jgi:hypothetical protein
MERLVSGMMQETTGSYSQKDSQCFPKLDRGYFHLTPRGWERKDSAPFPEDRLETWYYEMERSAEDSKEQVTLARSWTSPDVTPAKKSALLAAFGQAVEPTSFRNVTLKCYV